MGLHVLSPIDTRFAPRVATFATLPASAYPAETDTAQPGRLQVDIRLGQAYCVDGDGVQRHKESLEP